MTGNNLRAGARSCGCARVAERAAPAVDPPPGARLVPLTKGLFAIVDESDFERVSQHLWCAAKRKRTHYASRTVVMNGKERCVYMHAFIAGTESAMTDHKDGDGLNNRRENLRPCTSLENARNIIRSKHKSKTSRWKGVSFCRDRRTSRPWVAAINAGPTGAGWKGHKRINLGRFATEDEAARAYDAAARQHFGEFAATNFQE